MFYSKSVTFRVPIGFGIKSRHERLLTAHNDANTFPPFNECFYYQIISNYVHYRIL